MLFASPLELWQLSSTIEFFKYICTFNPWPCRIWVSHYLPILHICAYFLAGTPWYLNAFSIYCVTFSSFKLILSQKGDLHSCYNDWGTTLVNKLNRFQMFWPNSLHYQITCYIYFNVLTGFISCNARFHHVVKCHSSVIIPSNTLIPALFPLCIVYKVCHLSFVSVNVHWWRSWIGPKCLESIQIVSYNSVVSWSL